MLWIIGGIIVIGLVYELVFGGSGKQKSRKVSAPYKPTLIEHPHVIDDTEYECSVCGGRFDSPVSVCPFCGERFEGKKTDYEEFDFEEDELEAWDEEEGR